MSRLRILRKLRAFRTDEDGTASVEAVIWLPIFFFFISMVVDASFIFLGQNEATRLVQDANRRLSVGVLASSDEVEDLIEGALAKMAPSAVATSTISNGVVTTSVVIQTKDLVATNWIAALALTQFTVGASHYIEY